MYYLVFKVFGSIVLPRNLYYCDQVELQGEKACKFKITFCDDKMWFTLLGERRWQNWKDIN